jgi:hypothetical protein
MRQCRDCVNCHLKVNTSGRFRCRRIKFSRWFESEACGYFQPRPNYMWAASHRDDPDVCGSGATSESPED